MSSSVSTTSHGVVVITHVHPNENGLGMDASPPTCMGRVGPVVSSVMEKFREGHPKALGVGLYCTKVKIMFGAMAFLFGIVMTGKFSFGVLSGIFVWGSIVYTIAGSRTIAAEKSLNKCLVKASLGMNVVATVTACIGTIVYSLDAAGVLYYCYDYNHNNYGLLCQQCRAKHQGMSAVMVVFSVLEMMVTISVSAFACKAVCHSPPEMFIIGNHLPQGYSRLPCAFTDNIRIPPNSYEPLRTLKGPEEGLPPYNNNRPPQYSMAIIP